MVRTRATAAVDGQPPPPSVFDIDTTHTADDKHHRQPDTKRRKTTASGTLPESSIAQTKRLGPIKYTCTTCDTDRAASKFPDYNPTPQCDHLINTCKACLKEWIEICVEGGNMPIVPVPKKESETVKDDSDVAMIPDNQVKTVLSVPCPECGAVLNSEDVSRSATTKVFNRFKELNRKHICENTAGWMWCLSPRCNAGQVYVPKMKAEVVGKTGKAKSLWEKAKKAIKLTKPVDAGEPDTMVICHACSAKACGSCVRLWHEGET